MNSVLKRMGAGLLALMMVFCLLVVGLPSTIFAATGTLAYNTGTRHDYDVSLSSQALAYYTGNYTWDKLSKLEGGTENCLNIDNPMFEALHDLMADTMTKSVTYKNLPTYWAKTDAQSGTSNYVLFYTDIAGPHSDMNREHVWPKSHASFKESNGGADLHHLRPTVGNVNSARGNLIMGNVKGLSGASTYSYNGKVVLYKTSSLCEVNDNIKGDVARILLYVWCRWEEPNLFMNTSNPVVGPSDDKNDGRKVIESLDTLLQWCAMDPVDTWEMSRNDQVENVQGNRNVFIDYPEFAWLIFGRTVPTDLSTPSQGANNGTPPISPTNPTTPTTPTTPSVKYTQMSSLNDGDQIVIVNPASGMALSTVKNGYYNTGIDVSGNFNAITTAETFTAKKNSDGTWSFTTADGKKLAMADSYSSLNETGTNDRWELTSAGSNQFYLKNTGRDLYLQWYSSKSNWSAYNPDSLSKDYVLAFYKKASTGTDTPSTTTPSTPTTTKPGTTTPSTPTTTKPGTTPSTPTTTKPGTTTPSTPTTTKPGTTTPSTPTTTKPGTTTPSTPTTTKPGTTTPSTPTTTKPGTTTPSTPTTTKPGTTTPSTPITTNPGATVPASSAPSDFMPTDKTQGEIIDAAYALEQGASMTAPATLTGVIVSIDTDWSDQYGNITVTIRCAGKEDKPIMCYRLKGDGAQNLQIGDTITVEGTLTNYNGTIEFGAGCVLQSLSAGDGNDTDATQPGDSNPSTSSPATQPDNSSPSTSDPATQPGDSSPGTSQPAPLPTNSVPVPIMPGTDNTGTTILIVAIVLIFLTGGGAALYFFVIKPRIEKKPEE